MRNSILVTAVIAFLAGGLVLALAQSEQVKSMFGTKTEEAEVVTEVIATEEQAAEDTNTDAAVETAAGETATEATDDASAEAGQTEIDLSNDELADKLVKSENTEYVPTADEVEETASSNDTASGDFTVNVQAALKDRFVGKADAPIVIEDYSSLTCPHCAFFHNSIYPKIKEKYIDTGKVRWVFKGFPLNEPALRAEMVARCAPNDQYIKLSTFMYENQAKWAFTENPMATLNMMLRVAGVSNDVFNACATSTELENAMVQKLEAAAVKHSINSTPTFIIDGQKTIAGAGTFVGFSYDLDAILRAKGLYEEPAAPNYDSDAAVPPAASTPSAKAESTFTNK